jgi:hypothetical protein
MQQSLYIPKHESNFILVCKAWAKKQGFKTWSTFILHCIKTTINGLPRAEQKEFEDLSYTIAKKDRPEAQNFVDNFIARNP